ncbi:MAG: hypothetical protein LKK26_00950, partial [Solobacterium sp.]|nr:hypothetical protein [Solobacterium sp.]
TELLHFLDIPSGTRSGNEAVPGPVGPVPKDSAAHGPHIRRQRAVLEQDPPLLFSCPEALCFQDLGHFCGQENSMEDIERKQDLSLLLESCAKRFCLECGKPIEGNRRGSPRCFCSNRCRWAFSDAGFYLSGCCIWKKNALVLGRSPYQWQYEPCLFGWKKDGRHEWYSDRKQTTIWEYDRPKASKDHPTMKPVQLMTYPILNSSMPNGIVLDPFLGSGSTMIACEQTDRICRDIELDPKYVDVLVKRYIEHEDEKTQDVYVVRDGQKLTFEEAAADAGQGES